jgi:choline-sulfatase
MRAVILAVLASAIAFAQTPVIVISVDTLRADRVSHALNISSLGNGGTVFSQVDCQTPLTLPSHWSMMTSTYPFENRIEENGERVPAGAVTLATVLHARGYKTAAFIGSVFLDRQMGFDQGFDFFDSPFQGATQKRDGALVLRSARQWLSENRSQPLFAFVHLFDMHKPYPVSYDAQLQYVDRLIGAFKDSLTQMGLWDRALVVLVSDHGEGLGDHGEDSHGYFVYESTLHVPVIFHWPAGAVGHPARADEAGGLIDVSPTILDFLQIPKPAPFEGASLIEKHGGVFAESVHARDAFGWAGLRSFRVGQFKYIEAPRPELYDLRTDPGELKNLYTKGSAKSVDLRGQLARLMARYPAKGSAETQEISSGTRALLDSLGYLAPGPRGAISGAAVDPKDRLAEFRLYEASWLEIYYHRPDAGIAKLKQLLGGDPGNLLARRDLGNAYANEKDYAHAREAYAAVLAAAPDDYVAQYGIGLADERLGLLKEAKEHLEVACRIQPESAEARRELELVETGFRSAASELH